MAASKLGADGDAIAQAARTQQMNALIVKTMSPKQSGIDDALANDKAKNRDVDKTDAEIAWLVVHDTTLSSVGAGGTFIIRAGTRFTDLHTKHMMDSISAKYVVVE